MAIKKRQRQLKHPVIPELIYFDIIKNKQTILNLDQTYLKQFTGINWRDWGYKLYDILNEKYPGKFKTGNYSYTMQAVGSDQVDNGMIKILPLNAETLEFDDMNDTKEISKQLNELKSKLNNLPKSDFSTELLISITKQSYETQINFLQQQLTYKDNEIREHKTRLEKSQNDIDDLNQMIAEAESKTGIMQILEVGQKIFNLKLNQASNISLKESNVTDIPDDILQILGAVDYSKIDDSSYSKIVQGLKQYISLLPLKGQEHAQS